MLRSRKHKHGMQAALANVPADKRIVLHVGCGRRRLDTLHSSFHGSEWHELRLDINPDVKPDIIGTIVDMAGVASESVDAVWSSHNLEHVYAHEVPIVLGEFHRVICPGGKVLVTMPDLQSVAQYIGSGKLDDPCYQSPTGPIAPLDILYGLGRAVAEGNEFMAHRTGFTARTLTRKLRSAGFAEVDVRRSLEEKALWGLARRPA